jgi:KDO2-lipid IV(A) lauroyltransferase
LNRYVWRLALATKKVGDAVIGYTALFFLWLLGRFPAESAINFAGRAARVVGPISGRNRVALDNLRRAFPEKPEAEIRKICSDMWEHMGRLAAEYIFIADLFDYDRHTRTGKHIEVIGDDLFIKVAGENKPHIIFTGHLGNFELLPIAGNTFGMPVTALFRAPNNKYIANYIFRTRKDTMAGLLASRAGAAIELARILERGGHIGMLVDQKFRKGEKTTFFGRPCRTSPLLPKLARHYECDVYPTRCVRLPDNRYRLEIEDKLELPRDAEGHVDINRTCQLLNDTIERWVREDPAQWMWFHKRWSKEGKRKRTFFRPV